MQTKKQLILISEEQFSGELDASDLLSYFTCIICFGIAIEPLKCKGCETVYCSNCLPDYIVTGEKKRSSTKAYSCYKMCGNNTVTNLSRIEKNILNNFEFHCQHSESHGCTSKIKYENTRAHLEKECVHKLIFPEAEIKKPIIKVDQSELDGIAQANLPNLFQEEGEELAPDDWRFQQAVQQPAPIQPPRRVVEEESEDDIDMGDIFGGEDY